MTSLGVCMNVYNEANALPAALESAAAYADDICIYHTGPGGEYSTDGTIEICEKFGARIVYGSIDDGFGVVRTRLITMGQCEWTVILDADERLPRFAPRMMCHGSESYDGTDYPRLVDLDLRVQIVGVYDQVSALKALLLPEFDAIVTSRRHWQSWGFEKPSQNWQQIPDWQARILRNCAWVQYRSAVKMHEQLVDVRTGQDPRWYQPTIENCEVFHDHYHLAVKRMEPDQRQHDIAIYNALHEDRHVPTLAEFRAGAGAATISVPTCAGAGE